MGDQQSPSARAAPGSNPGIGFRRIARGAVWNWSQVVLTGGLAFFVSPYVVHHLGSTAYGVWILINSVVAYAGLLDLGMRGAVVRFVSADHPLGRHEEASRAVSAALWFRLWLGGLVIAVSLGLALVATKAFHMPAEMHNAARVAFLLTGCNLAVSLNSGVFSGVLNALHRFDLISIAMIGQAAMNAGGLVVLLGRGEGIIAIAVWQLVTGVLNAAFLCWAAFRVYPELRLVFRVPEREMLRKFGSYSFFLFLNAVAGQVIYYTDNLVIGAALPVSAVTLYALGFAPTQYLRQAVSSLAVTFMPAASSLAAQGDYEQLRRLLVQGTRAVMVVALPIEVGLLFRGKTFISLWMGPQYGEPSGQVLQVLILAWFFMAGNACAGNIVYGLSRHKPVAIWTIIEAIANLVLSVALVSRWGVIGVAWGTTLPSLIINAIFWPRYVTAVLAIPLRQYVYQSWIRPAIAVMPFAVGCYLAERWWAVDRLGTFFLQMSALFPLVLIGFGLLFRRELGVLLRRTGWPRSSSARETRS